MSQNFLRLPLRRARGNQPTYQGVWAKHFTPPLGRPLVTGITGDRETWGSLGDELARAGRRSVYDGSMTGWVSFVV